MAAATPAAANPGGGNLVYTGVSGPADAGPPDRMPIRLTRRTLGFALIGAGIVLLGPALRVRADAGRVESQDQAPNRREFVVTARDYRFSPSRIEVAKDDLVKLTVQSEDVAYSLTIDAYRLSRRIPAGGSAIIEFRADVAGSFPFYSNLTSDSRHSQMRGELVVSGR